jgi:diguanylate cyclase (GGDEF)-like protein/PAS domain S-box-containing protein
VLQIPGVAFTMTNRQRQCGREMIFGYLKESPLGWEANMHTEHTNHHPVSGNVPASVSSSSLGDMDREHFKAIVNSTDDAVISKTLDGVVTSWNPGAQRLFGYTAAEMVGQSLLLLFPAGRLDEERFILEKIQAGERVDHFETQRVHKDGHLLHVSVSISPIHDSMGRVVGASKIARDISERIRLETTATVYEAIVQSSDDAIIGKTLDGIITSWNQAAEVMFGYTAAEIVGQPITTIMPVDRRHEMVDILEKIRRGERIAHFETLRLTKSGEILDVSVTISPIIDRDGRVIGASKIARDITQSKNAFTRLQLTSNVFTHTSEAIVITDPSGCILEVNAAFTQITGYSYGDVVGRPPTMFRSSRQGPEVYANLIQTLKAEGHCQGEIWSRRKDGVAYAGLLTVSAVRDQHNQLKNYVALFADITPLREHQERLEHVAHYDPLTNLPNRLLLADRLQQAMVMGKRHRQSLAVLYLDLDGFKAVNDGHGHNVGDDLLIAISQRMKAVLRESDTLARMGGDEFVVVQVDVMNSEDCFRLADRILQACAAPVLMDGALLQVSASIGVTIYPADDVSADQLMRHADQAMYEAKQAGKNRYHLFDSAHEAEVISRSERLERIAVALRHSELLLYFQPKVHMRTGEVLGMEALIRWNHPERGLLAPADFLPAVEGHPLGDAIGAWVMDTALTQMAAWNRVGLVLPVSVNVGARQLQQDGFVEKLQALLASHPDVAPSLLELEILETSALEDIVQVSSTMQACSQLGVSFAVDDFGTGYSSLTYLRRLPAATLKIDQSFVINMLDSPEDLAIVQGVLGLARAFDRKVIAEGVETLAHGSRLLELGCDSAQGYGIARPMPAKEVAAWVAAWKPHAAWSQSA